MVISRAVSGLRIRALDPEIPTLYSYDPYLSGPGHFFINLRMLMVDIVFLFNNILKLTTLKKILKKIQKLKSFGGSGKVMFEILSKFTSFLIA